MSKAGQPIEENSAEPVRTPEEPSPVDSEEFSDDGPEPTGSSRAGRWLMILGVVVSLIAAAFLFTGRPVSYVTGLLSTARPATTVPPGFFDSMSPPVSVGVVPEPLLNPRTSTLTPDVTAVAKRVKAVPRTNLGTTGMVFVDASTGNELYSENASRALAPASTIKVLTSISALDLLGAGATFTTKVVQTTPGSIIIVGGGDPTLTATTKAGYPRRPSLQQLAALTAKALKATKTVSVALGYDVSLFTGPTWHPDWPDSYDSEVSQIVPLWVDSGRAADGYPEKDPVSVAVNAFAAQLAAQGIKVTSTKPVTADATATPLAAVESPPVSVIVEQLLLHSDNDYTELLGRHMAIAAGLPGSFVASATTISETLNKLGLRDPGTEIRDASGLSKLNRVTPSMLARAMLRGIRSDTLSPVVTGLPLAGVTGTLAGRFGAASGRGHVWAKTGYLNGVHGLAGVLVTNDGSQVVFALLVNGQLSRGIAQPSLDAITSAVVQCGCR